MRLVREAERERITGCPRSTWYWLQSKGEAPKPVPLGANTVAWIEQELFDWVQERISHRGEPNAMKEARIKAVKDAKRVKESEAQGA